MLPLIVLSLAMASAPTPVDENIVAGQAYQHRLADSLAASDAPRDHALSAMVWPFFDAAGAAVHRGAVLRDAAQAAPTDRLVQWLWAIAPADVVECKDANSCSTRAFALARIEPDNVAAWFPVMDAAWRDQDAARADAALEQMARASYYDDLFVEVALAWRDVHLRYPLPTPIAEDASPPPTPGVVAMTAGIARSAATVLPGAASLIRACDRAKQPQAAPERFEHCAQIGRVLLRRGTTVMAQRNGLALLRVAGAMGADDEAARRTIDWRMTFYASMGEDLAAYFADLESTGSEIRAQELSLHRAGVPLEPPAGWPVSTPSGSAKP